MARYDFLPRHAVEDALEKLRAALLAAKDGHDVDEIIQGLLTPDEYIKLGRRIEVARLLKSGMTYREISDDMSVGLSTVKLVARKLYERPRCYKLIHSTEQKIDNEHSKERYRKTGSLMMIRKRKIRTSRSPKDVRVR